LFCSNNQLSVLDLTYCSQLVEVRCQQNQLIKLTFPLKLSNLEKLDCHDNSLTNLDWAALNGEKLTVLSLANNNFPSRDLSFLTDFTNLKELHLGNMILSDINSAKIQRGIYNR